MSICWTELVPAYIKTYLVTKVLTCPPLLLAARVCACQQAPQGTPSDVCKQLEDYLYECEAIYSAARAAALAVMASEGAAPGFDDGL